MIRDDRRPVLQAAVSFRVLDDFSSVVLDSSGGEAYALNPVGTAIVERCDGTLTVDEMVTELVDLFEVDDRTLIVSDVHTFLREMTVRGLVAW